MFIPAQGFRHAATLLLARRIRAVPADASLDDTCAALERLAYELVALADDMRAPADAADWLIAELAAAVDRMSQVLDRDMVKSAAASILTRVASRTRTLDRRDVFLVYLPEDRLPIAAPLAVELAKRRMSVAFAEYEVATESELSAAIARGLACHRCGVVLHTKAFDRARWALPLFEDERVRIVRELQPSTSTDLAEWITQMRMSKL